MEDKEAVFVLHGEEITISQKTLELGSKYFAELLSTPEEYPQVRILLPDWVSRRVLVLYLDYIRSRKLPILDVLTAQKLLWLADFLQDPSLQAALIADTIVPHLTKDSVLLFLQDSYTKLSIGTDSHLWKNLLVKCLEIAATESAYIFSRFKTAILALAPELVEQLVYRASMKAGRHSATDYTDMLEVLRSVRNANSWVELLNMEQEKALNSGRWRRERKPVFIWNIDNISLDNYFRESDSFEVAGMSWSVSVWSFAHENKLDIAIRNTPGADTAESFPRHSLVALTCSCQLDDEELPPPLIITTLIGTKTQNVIRSLHSASSLSLSHLTLSIHIEIEYVYSSLLTHIIKHPTSCLTGNISSVPSDKLLAMLKHKSLAVANEDEVVDLVGRWYQEINPEVDICDLLEAVKWPFVSLKGLFDAVRNWTNLKNSKCFREIFRRELEHRATPKRDAEAPVPRRSYKDDHTHETFPNPKAFVETLSGLLLDLEFNPEADTVLSTQENEAMEAEMQLALAQRDKEIKELEAAIFALEVKSPPVGLSSFRDLSPSRGNREEMSAEEEQEDPRNESYLSVPRKPVRLHPRSSSHEGRRSLSRSGSTSARPKIKAVVDSIRSRLPVSGRNSALSRASDFR